MPVKDCETEIKGVATHYLRAGGTGSALVLLHGGSADSASLSWRPSMDLFARSHRVFAPDLPGYGSSAKPDLNYTVEYYTRFLSHFVQQLGLEGFSLVGLSMGGHIAGSFALQFPSLVEKLVLVNSAGLGTQWHWRMLAKLMVKMPRLHKTVREMGNRQTMKLSLGKIVHNLEVITDDLIDEIARNAAARGAGRAWRSYLENEMNGSGFRNGILDRLSEITQPTLIIHGSKDRMIPVKWATKAHQLIPDSRLCILERCGHWPQREKPVEFHEAVLEFLDEE
jgi:pimeloyl-ACP methyl ester carboxylesterase